MKVLVTGATGFIGRRLCALLAARGIEVRALYRNSAGVCAANIEWVRIRSMDDAAQWPALLHDVDCAIHLAGLAHQIGRAGEGRWQEFHQTNVVATEVLAHACVQAHVARLVFVSSIAVCRSVSPVPVTIDMAPAPQSDYGRSKLEAEQALKRALASTTVDWCILRPPVVYGPGNPGNMERLLRLVCRGLPLPIGAIGNRRSFMFIDNLVDVLYLVTRHEGEIRATFMVGDDTDLSTPDLVRALAAAGGVRARIFRIPLWTLRLMGTLADLVGSALGRTLPFDSYSIDKLTESLQVDSADFRRRFAWQPPVPTARALAVTCEQILHGRSL